MLPYILLMFVPLLFSFAMFSRCNGRHTLVLGSSREVLKHSCMLPVFFLLLTVLLSLRDESIGRDLANYKLYFNQISSLAAKDIFRVELDVLYVFLNWIISRFTNDFQLFLSIVAIITVLPIAAVYCTDREHGFLKLILFMNMSTFVMMFSGLRQALAISIGMIAYEFVKRKRPIKFLLLSIIAWGFHHTAFMLFFFYPLYHATFRKKHLWFVVPVISAVAVFNKPIFTIATYVINLLSNEKYTATIDSTGAYTMLILFAIFAIFCYVVPEEEKMDKETLGLRNFLLMAVLLQCFAPIHTLAMRVNYYYILFVPMLIPKIIKHTKKNFANAMPLIKGCLIVFFVGYYLLTTYISCKTGVSALDTYPYIPFWE